MGMDFEYDPVKSDENKRKHGIDFEEAQAFWNDPLLLEIPVRGSDEPRWLVIGRINFGKIGEKLWSAFITRRGENVRIISVRRSRDKEARFMKAKTLDRMFDAGQDIVEHLDLSKARRVGNDPKRVNVDFPIWMVKSLDREAQRLGVTRQSLIKLWLADRLAQAASNGKC
jgi:uncharacterized DUF497 family protein